MRKPEGIRTLPFSSVVWALPLATSLHNVEEWIWLPAQALPDSFSLPVGSFEFRFALLVVTAVYWLVAFKAASAPPHSPWIYAALAAAGILSLNVVFPHVLATVALGIYAPGVVTAVLLNTWIPPLVMAAALRQGFATSSGAVKATLAACALVPLALALTFLAGRCLAGIGSFG